MPEPAKLNMTREEFRKRIIEFRKSGGMTQEDLAHYLGGVTVSTVGKWERGIVVPSSRAMIGKLMQMRVLEDKDVVYNATQRSA